MLVLMTWTYCPKKVLFELIKQILTQTRELLPHTVIFWSQILPQVVYVSAMKRNKIEWVGHAINRWVGALFRSSPGGLITHPQIQW